MTGRRRLEPGNEAPTCGYILKSDSPSCGMERVRVYGSSGIPSKSGVGIFARALMDRLPLLPVELGYFKRDLDAQDKAEILALIADYHQGLVPLVVPLTLLKHHLAGIDVPYLQDQLYLNPHPKDLRPHVPVAPSHR